MRPLKRHTKVESFRTLGTKALWIVPQVPEAIVENIGLEIEPNEHNRKYLLTKKNKMGHSLGLDLDH